MLQEKKTAKKKRKRIERDEIEAPTLKLFTLPLLVYLKWSFFATCKSLSLLDVFQNYRHHLLNVKIHQL